MAFKRNNNVIDSPGNNFATLNPLVQTSATLSEGNLKCAVGTSAAKVFGNFLLPNSGKWYWEVMFISGGDNSEAGGGVGIAKITTSTSAHVGNDAESYAYRQNGHKANSGSAEAYHDSYTNLKVIQFLWNGDNKSITFGVDGSMATSEAYAELSGEFYPAFGDNSSGSSATFSVNFGQDPTFTGEKTDSAGFSPTDGSPGRFYYQPPEGAKALCSANLPMLIENPQEHFKAVTWTGTESTGPSDANSIYVGHQPDLIWIKSRNAAHSHYLFDSVRGLSNGNWLISDTTDDEETAVDQQFNITSTGIDLLTGYNATNNSDTTYVGWCWKAGGGGGKYNIDGVPYLDFANTGLTAGDITPSKMSVNTKAGFSIVKYEGNGNTGAKIAHGLNSAPEMIILKGLENTFSWETQHKDISLVGAGLHFDTATKYNSGASDRWNSQRADSSVITVSNNGAVNESGKDYIMYSWHSVPGYSSIGSYTGNGSADGPFVYTGFKPAWVMIKNTSDSNSWMILDNQRSIHNLSHQAIRAESSGLEITNQETNFGTDLLSNGFKPKTSGATTVNSNNAPNNEYIYMAFAEHSM